MSATDVAPTTATKGTATTARAVAFFGASGGCGLSALKHTLAAGYHCIALCRSGPKLAALFPDRPKNLTVVEGNAHDEAAVKKCLVHPSDLTALVDSIVFTIGSPLIISKMTTADPDVCKRGAATLVAALASLRAEGSGRASKPRISAISTTGISKFGRDVPVAMLPMYHALLRVPHADKKVMEERFLASGERVVFVRPSFLVDGETSKPIRVGVEDPVRGRESKAVGYAISREDVGRWMYEALVQEDKGDEYTGKAVMITY